MFQRALRIQAMLLCLHGPKPTLAYIRQAIVKPVVAVGYTQRMYSSSTAHDASVHDKEIVFVRHGKTEMNEKTEEISFFSPDFVDVGLWDTRLSKTGLIKAKEVHHNLLENGHEEFDFNKVETLYASPLTRALHTAEIVFNHKKSVLSCDVPKKAHPLLRERLYMSSEVGRPKTVLETEFPHWDFAHVPEDEWWYTHDDTDPYVEWRPPGTFNLCKGEPSEVFRQRMGDLRQWLLSRPEKCLAVVAHWGTLKALTGLSFENCELKVCRASDILPEPLVDKYL